MFLSIAVVLGVALLAVQLTMCLKCKRLWMKLSPMLLLGAGELACWSVIWLSGYVTMPYGTAFSAYIYAMLFLLFLGSDVFAWAVYGIVQLVQKRRK